MEEKEGRTNIQKRLDREISLDFRVSSLRHVYKRMNNDLYFSTLPMKVDLEHLEATLIEQYPSP